MTYLGLFAAAPSPRGRAAHCRAPAPCSNRESVRKGPRLWYRVGGGVWDTFTRGRGLVQALPLWDGNFDRPRSSLFHSVGSNQADLGR